jgi:hypothetical protein
MNTATGKQLGRMPVFNDTINIFKKTLIVSVALVINFVVDFYKVSKIVA